MKPTRSPGPLSPPLRYPLPSLLFGGRRIRRRCGARARCGSSTAAVSTAQAEAERRGEAARPPSLPLQGGPGTAAAMRGRRGRTLPPFPYRWDRARQRPSVAGAARAGGATCGPPAARRGSIQKSSPLPGSERSGLPRAPCLSGLQDLRAFGGPLARLRPPAASPACATNSAPHPTSQSEGKKHSSPSISSASRRSPV